MTSTDSSASSPTPGPPSGSSADSSAGPSSSPSPSPPHEGQPTGATVAATRAGRNLTQAVVVGVGLAGLVLLSLLVQKVAFVALAGIAVTIALFELANALTERDIRMPAAPVTVGGAAMIIAAYFGGAEPLVVALVLTALATFAWRLPGGGDGYLRDTSAGVFAALYAPFLAGTAMLMLRPEDGPLRIVVFVVVVVCSDVGGYAVGVFAGRHPMAPTVSRKKSWEGFAGSVFFCVVGGSVSAHLLLDAQCWLGAALGGAVAVTLTLRVLAVCLLKGDLGIQEMGSMLPGHGGMMDRLDSLLPSAPAVYVLLYVFVGAGGT